MSHVTEFKFEIETGPDLPEDEVGPLGPAAELMPFTPMPVTEADVVGRRVEKVSGNLGTYGMGGPGFVGLLLGNEWLVVALWGATEWLHFNGRSLQDQSNSELQLLMVGRTIARLRVDRAAMELTLSDGGQLRVEADPATRPIWQGTREPRAFAPDDDLRRVVFLAPDAPLWI